MRDQTTPVLGELHLVDHDPANPQIYTLSLHDALPISAAAQTPHGTGSPRSHPVPAPVIAAAPQDQAPVRDVPLQPPPRDRKSTRLNSSHGYISYAVFCLKKKKT